MTDYRQLQKDALDAAGGDRWEATSLIEDALESAAINGDQHAQHLLKTARRRGLRDHLNYYCRTSHGRLALISIGVTVPAGKSVHRRTKYGREKQLHLPFLDMEFDEIRTKIQEIVGQRSSLYHTLIAAARLLELEGCVPGARTPRTALRAMQMSLDEWLVGARVPLAHDGGR